MTRRLVAVCLGWMLVALAGTASAADIDPAASQVGFSLRTRWGQALLGRFADYSGEVAPLADGRHQVRLRLSARTVEIVGHSSYTRMTRGRGFFDATHYPVVLFVSDAYPPDLLRRGGKLPGVLTLHGVSRREVFDVAPAACAEPARDCDVVASGRIDRGHYSMGRWSFALADTVDFALRVRVREHP